MTWYKKFLSAVRKIYVPANDYDKLQGIVEKIVRGHRDWTAEELQLQQNYSEAIEALLRNRK